MDILKHTIHKAIYDLCSEIEKLPASEQQTKVVVMASSLHVNAEILLDALRDMLLTYRDDTELVIVTEERMEAWRRAAELPNDQAEARRRKPMIMKNEQDSQTPSDPAVASSDLLGAVGHTSRGFEIVDFKDRNGVACSLQASSLAEYEKPGTSAVWLGCDDANPMILLPEKGWKKVEWLPGTIATTRMHLNREQVAALIAHLQAWLDRDTFAPNSD